VTIRYSLFAARVLDRAVDMDRTKNSSRTLVVVYNDAVTARRDVGVIWRRHGIFVIACSYREWDERNAVQSLSEFVYHDSRLYQKLARPHYLLAVEPDIEITTDAVDVRFGSPVCTGVLGVWMTKRNVDSGNFFIL
jgi:hypothetical protein